MNRRFALIGAALLTVVAAVATVGATLTLPDGRVATLNGQAVSKDELLFQMRRLDRTVSWDGDTRVLADRALDEIRSSHALLSLAKEQGLVASADYADFLAEVQAENSARADAGRRGETIYGLTNFTPEEYYSHRLSELTSGLEGKLGRAEGDPLWVSDTEVRRKFDTDPQAWSANSTIFTYTQLAVPAGADPGRINRLQDVRVPGARLTTGKYSAGTSNGVNPHDQELSAVLSSLSPGQISDPVIGTSQITYYRLDGEKVDREKSFATYASRIRQSLLEEKLKALLEQRRQASSFTVDASAVDGIKAEDVQG
jgi:hypothetical protein